MVTALGIVVALAAAVANAFAVVLQAAEDRQAPLTEGGRVSLFVRLVHRPRWLAGTSLMVIAWPLQVLALGLAPITVVQPMLAATQLVLLAVARVQLRERVGLTELGGALAIVVGIGAVVWAAPRHTVASPDTPRLIVGLVLVGGGALLCYLAFRLRPARAMLLIVGAGLAYAWVDFANKLLANDIAQGNWALAAAWLAATILFGGLAFLEETTALQRRPAVTVSPVVGAVQDPLPVVLALWAGVETWGNGSQHLAALVGGLAVVTVGAALLGSSRAVARVAGDAPVVASGSRPRLGRCAPTAPPRPVSCRESAESPDDRPATAEADGWPEAPERRRAGS